MPDEEDDPITFDFADEEVNNITNAAEKEQQAETKKKMEEAHQKAISELEAKMEAEKLAQQEEIDKRM